MFEDDEITQQREDAARLRQRQREDDVKAQMATLSGRRFVWDLLSRTRYEGRSTSSIPTADARATCSAPTR